MPTRHHRIQVTEDPELANALRTAAPHLPAGLPRAAAVRQLAIAGARQLTEKSPTGMEQRAKLEELANHFREPETAPWDWGALRESKSRAWPVR